MFHAPARDTVARHDNSFIHLCFVTGINMTPEDARRRIAVIRADKAHPFFAESHPEHGRAVRDMEALYADVYPEPAVENPFDRPSPAKAPPPADPAIKHREAGVFWQQSAPIPREDLGAAQEKDEQRRAQREQALEEFRLQRDKEIQETIAELKRHSLERLQGEKEAARREKMVEDVRQAGRRLREAWREFMGVSGTSPEGSGGSGP